VDLWIPVKPVKVDHIVAGGDSAWLDALNERIVGSVGSDARNLQIGHSYLMDRGRAISSMGSFVQALRDDVVPLLQEYCYENYEALEKILGNKLVDSQKQRIRADIFEPANQPELIDALLSMDPDMATSPEAIEAEADVPQDDEDEQDADSEADAPADE